MNSATRKRACGVRAARAEDLQSIRRIVAAAGLPAEDVSAEMLEHFIVCARDGAVIGVVGLELYGARALLRSLAVDEACRSEGIAARLLADIEKHAQQVGVSELFTLTATAQRYLENHGYTKIERCDAPDAIQAHAQFQGLCPETAVCLSKPMEESSTNQGEDPETLAAKRSGELFDTGLYCAESVLQAIAESLDEECSSIPRIATGLCSGIARSSDLCGALSGAILGLGLAMGRTTPDESVDPIYEAVRTMRDRFEQQFGSSNCLALTGCDLGTSEGQERFEATKQCAQCRTYIIRATQWAMAAIHAH